MDIETLRIENRDYMGNQTSSILIEYEYHADDKKLTEDGHEVWNEFLVLRSVEIELDEYGSKIIPIELNDELFAHYSRLLSKHQHGLEVKEMIA